MLLIYTARGLPLVSQHAMGWDGDPVLWLPSGEVRRMTEEEKAVMKRKDLR